MLSRFLTPAETYDGSQLKSLRNYLKHGLLGDSVAAWVGPCAISADLMVDGEDLVAGAAIRGDQMLHFVIELFDCTLLAAVALQRLLAAIVRDHVGGELRREGDDLYLGARKLSISIATQSPVSSLIHFAVNVTNEGTPVETLALGDLGLDPRAFAERVIESFTREYEDVRRATRKVRWVG